MMEKTAGNATRGRGEDAWRLELEGETETRIVADRVEGIYVDLDGEGHQERGQVENHRSQSDVPGEAAEEIKSQKRKIIRMESEETQDQEEAEELSFVPSAIGVPRKPIFRCDNQCSEKKKTFSFWQLASVVLQEGEESCTTNLCQECYNDSLKAKGEKPLKKWQW